MRNKKATWGAITWVGLLSLSLLYRQLYSPLNPCQHLRAWDDGLGSFLHLWHIKLSRMGIGHKVLGAWPIKEDELEAIKKKEPIGPAVDSTF